MVDNELYQRGGIQVVNTLETRKRIQERDETLSPNLRAAICCRASLRTLTVPFLELTENFKKYELNVLRSILLNALVAFSGRSSKTFEQMVNDTAVSVLSSGKIISFEEHISSRRAINAATLGVMSGEPSKNGMIAYSDALASALEAGRYDPSDTIFGIFESAVINDREQFSELDACPLWIEPATTAVTDRHNLYLDALHAKKGGSFWLRFYKGMWEGTFDDWDLAFEVIKIDEADWEKGYVYIGEVIAGLAQALAKDAIDELQLQPHDRFGIGGNNPPPDEKLNLATLQIREGAALVSDQLDAATPDKSLLQRGIELMGKGLLAFIKWLGRKGDFTVDQLIKWGVPTGCAYALANPAKVQAAIDAAKSWLALL